LNIPIACLCNPTRPERRVRESERVTDRERRRTDHRTVIYATNERNMIKIVPKTIPL
jgi:hypothetical protein